MTRGFQRYVALGDSQTEGLLDPDGHGGYRGWADRLAEHLAAVNPHVQYANLAIRGRLLGEIRTEQLDVALAMHPDLVTVMGGLNDMLRPSFEPDVALGHLDAMLSQLRLAGALALTNTFPDIAAVAPILGRLAPRVFAFNDGIRDLAHRHGALVVDFAARGAGTDPRIWSPDRIHANPLGHSLMAAAFADALGLPGFARWDDPLPAAAPIGRLRSIGRELHWAGGTLAPWIVRRLRGHSSGDGITAKRPRLVPVAPLFHIVAPGGWPAAGEYRPSSLTDDGFVHFSFADQVAASADRHYGDAAELVAVEIDATRIGAEIRVEDSYGSGTAYPHGYGPIPVESAVAVHPLRRGGSGGWEFSPDAARAAAASPDH